MFLCCQDGIEQLKQENQELSGGLDMLEEAVSSGKVPTQIETPPYQDNTPNDDSNLQQGGLSDNSLDDSNSGVYLTRIGSSQKVDLVFLSSVYDKMKFNSVSYSLMGAIKPDKYKWEES